MQILLINSNFYKLPVPTMPFGLCYVAAALEEAGYDVDVLDLCFSKKPSADVIERIQRSRPDLVGVSIRNIDTCATYDTLFLLEEVRREVIDPLLGVFSGTVVIGGASVGVNGTEMLEYFGLNYAIQGDGEEAMLKFIQLLESEKPLNGLPGLIWRKGDGQLEENPPCRTETIDRLPWPRVYRYIDLEQYKKFKSPIQVQTKRGCSLNCVYCTYKMIEGEKYRLRDPQKVADEIEDIYLTTGYRQIEFTDSTFNIPLDHAKAVLRAVIAKRLPLELQTMGLNPGGIDEEFAGLLKEARFKEIQIGVDSGCDVTLKSLQKNYSEADIMRVGDILQKKKIPVMWYVLTGAPHESKDTLRRTVETISRAASSWDIVIFGNGIRIYKGAPLVNLITDESIKASSRNFLYPVSFQPESIDLLTLRDYNKKLILKHPNFLFFDEVQRVPYFLQKLQNVFIRTFAPSKPWWKFNILVNKFLKIIGIRYLQGILSRSNQEKFIDITVETD